MAHRKCTRIPSLVIFRDCVSIYEKFTYARVQLKSAEKWVCFMLVWCTFPSHSAKFSNNVYSRVSHSWTDTWLDFYCVWSFYTAQKSEWSVWRHCRNRITWLSKYERLYRVCHRLRTRTHRSWSACLKRIVTLNNNESKMTLPAYRKDLTSPFFSTGGSPNGFPGTQ